MHYIRNVDLNSDFKLYIKLVLQYTDYSIYIKQVFGTRKGKLQLNEKPEIQTVPK